MQLYSSYEAGLVSEFGIRRPALRIHNGKTKESWHISKNNNSLQSSCQRLLPNWPEQNPCLHSPVHANCKAIWSKMSLPLDSVFYSSLNTCSWKWSPQECVCVWVGCAYNLHSLLHHIIISLPQPHSPLGHIRFLWWGVVMISVFLSEVIKFKNPSTSQLLSPWRQPDVVQ